MKKVIWVAGDFLVDRFVEGHMNGPRFVVNRIKERPGGADNTYYNALNICKNSEGIEVRSMCGGYRTLTRYITDNELVLEAWDCEQSEIHKTLFTPMNIGVPMISRLPEAIANTKADWNALVVSEYNKGAANVQPDYLNNMSKAPDLVDLLVVDSRYRTIHPDIVSMGQTAIWRCTGDEYDEQYGRQFHWVVHTNHGGQIKLLNQSQQLQMAFKPPNIEVIDSIGAGDTFTAALAAYLTKAAAVNADLLFEAIVFAAKAAQDVCKKPLTAVTDVTLE